MAMAAAMVVGGPALVVRGLIHVAIRVGFGSGFDAGEANLLGRMGNAAYRERQEKHKTKHDVQ